MNSIGCRNIINYQDFHIFSAEQRRCIEKQSNCYGKTYKWTGFFFFYYLFIFFCWMMVLIFHILAINTKRLASLCFSLMTNTPS